MMVTGVTMFIFRDQYLHEKIFNTCRNLLNPPVYLSYIYLR